MQAVCMWRTIKGYCFLSKILRNHLLSEHMQWNYASFNVTSKRLMSTSSKKNYQTAKILYTWPLIPSSFSPLKESHTHFMHDHGIFHHCMTSSLTLNNWGQKYCQTLGYEPNPSIPPCDLIQRLILPTIQKYSLLLKLNQHMKQLRMDTNTQKIDLAKQWHHHQKTELFPVIWYLKCHSSWTHFYKHLTESTKMA